MDLCFSRLTESKVKMSIWYTLILIYPVCSFKLTIERSCCIAGNPRSESIYDDQRSEQSSPIVRVKDTNKSKHEDKYRPGVAYIGKEILVNGH